MSEPRSSHLVFSCGSRWYAAPAEYVSEIVALPELTRMPEAPSYLMGVFAHRGEVVPVVDLALLTGDKTSDGSRVVLLRVAEGVLALVASIVAGISALDGRLESLGSAGAQPYLQGSARTTDYEVAVINPEGLFAFLSNRNDVRLKSCR